MPEKVLTNADLEKMVETSDEWIQTRTGIRERHIAEDNETTCDLAEQAARKAMDAAAQKILEAQRKAGNTQVTHEQVKKRIAEAVERRRR